MNWLFVLETVIVVVGILHILNIGILIGREFGTLKKCILIIFEEIKEKLKWVIIKNIIGLS